MLDAWTSTRYTQYRPDLKSTLRLPFFFFGKIEDRAFYLFQNWKQSRLKLMTSLNSFFLPSQPFPIFFLSLTAENRDIAQAAGGGKGRPTSKLERKKKGKKERTQEGRFFKFIMNKNPSGIVKSTRKRPAKHKRLTSSLFFFFFGWNYNKPLKS